MCVCDGDVRRLVMGLWTWDMGSESRQTATRHVLTIPVGLVPWKRAEPEEEAHEAL